MNLSQEAVEAILETIEHWKNDILLPQLAGKRILSKRGHLVWEGTNRGVKIGASACPLCVYQGNDCWSCPLASIDPPCPDEQSRYGRFRYRPTIENTIEVIKLLFTVLEIAEIEPALVKEEKGSKCYVCGKVITYGDSCREDSNTGPGL